MKKTVVAVALAVTATAAVSLVQAAPALGAPEHRPYKGLGTWIDIYDSREDAPGDVIRRMKARGVRTLYLQTSNYRRGVAIKWRSRVDAYLDAASRRGIRVVAWYLPGFRDLRVDYRRSIRAIRFRTDEGNRFDSFALDIESPEVSSPERRTRRLLRLSGRIERSVRPGYPLGAIIPSPRGMEKNPEYWPGFPYKRLANIYDVFVPMTYYTWRVDNARGAHDYTTRNIRIIRRETGISNIPIHVIGGIANESTGKQTMSFVRATRENGILGASFYTFFVTDEADWRELKKVPANPVQEPALPVHVGYERPLGFNPSDQTHPNEVFYRAGPIRRGRWLAFSVYDVQTREVGLWVNWDFVNYLRPTRADAWSPTRRVWLPARLLRDERENFISFKLSEGPRRSWGVRSVALDRR